MENENQELSAVEHRLADAGVRCLVPESTRIFEGTFSLLHCSVAGVDLFRGVFAVRMFPVRHPERFISLRYTDIGEKEREIGVVIDLAVFPADQQEMVRSSLATHYHEQVVRRVLDVRHEFGLLFFEVETSRGRVDFVTHWRGDRAEDYGEKGKIILDAMDKRFIIPDVDALPAADRVRFTNYIYW